MKLKRENLSPLVHDNIFKVLEYAKKLEFKQ